MLTPQTPATHAPAPNEQCTACPVWRQMRIVEAAKAESEGHMLHNADEVEALLQVALKRVAALRGCPLPARDL